MSQIDRQFVKEISYRFTFIVIAPSSIKRDFDICIIQELRCIYHRFYGVEAPVLVGEVSTVNDDTNDNFFYNPVGRFPDIEEDEKPLYLLATDYEKYL